MSTQFLLAASLLALALTPLASTLNAATYCVSSAGDLYSTLQTAADSAADDEVRLALPVFTGLTARTFNVRGNLVLSGGWNAGCVFRSSLSARSTLAANTNTAVLTFEIGNADFELDRISATGWERVQIDDSNATGASLAGAIRVHRYGGLSNGAGLRIAVQRHSVRVSSSIFSGNALDGLIINGLTGGGVADRTALVQYSTFANNGDQGAAGFSAGLRIDTSQGSWASVLVENSVSHANLIDFNLLGIPMLVRHTFYNTINPSAQLTPESVNDRSGDPGINAALRPIEPTSQLINNAFSGFTLFVDRDFSGSERVIGTRGDLGAYESLVNNSSTLTVTSDADSGTGSLRSIIALANGNTQTKTIRFNIPGNCPRSIALQSPLPALTQDVTIDGYSQSGSSPNDSFVSFDGTVCVFLTGANTVSTGLHLQTGNVDAEMSLSGLGFYGFSSEAVKISGPGRGNVTGSLFGTGLPLFGSVFADSVIRVQNAPRSRIGGLDSADRNVLPMGGQAGVNLEASTSGARQVYNNFIGVNRAGTGLLTNGSSPRGVGVQVTGSTGDDLRSNHIGGSESHGVVLAGGVTPALQTKLSFNRIGIAPDGSDVGNASNAVRILGGERHSLFRNTLHNNDGDALAVVSPARRAELLRNTFFGNTGLAIDLSPNGVNPIDLDVGQTGANDQQNYPEILSARGSDVQGEIRYRLQSANGTYRIQFFANLGCFPSSGGFTQARFFLAETSLTLACATSTSNCSLASTALVDNSEQFIDSLINKGITAIAIDEEGNSSELTPSCELYTQGDNIFKDGFE